jgi:hypothetical protein
MWKGTGVEISMLQHSTWNFQLSKFMWIFNVTTQLTWSFQRGVINVELSTWSYQHGIFEVEIIKVEIINVEFFMCTFQRGIIAQRGT